MKAIVLAGGFAKRLWPLTHEQAKPLIDVGGKPVINYIIERLIDLKKQRRIDEIFVSINSKFENDFKRWLETYDFDVKVVVEKSNHEGEKLGAIGGINFLLNKEHIDDNVLVINGDNVFDDKFSFSNMIDFFHEKQGPVLCGFDVKTEERAKLFGVIIFDECNKIIDFIEKPEHPKSTFISMGFYIFNKDALKLLKGYISEGNPPDKPGEFIQWLHKKQDVFVYPFIGNWFDIGDHDTLHRARGFVEGK